MQKDTSAVDSRYFEVVKQLNSPLSERVWNIGISHLQHIQISNSLTLQRMGDSVHNTRNFDLKLAASERCTGAHIIRVNKISWKITGTQTTKV